MEIINNDCLKAIPVLEKESIDVIVTSCPYNIGIDYNTYKDNKNDNEYLSWLKSIAEELFRVLKPNGSFFLNVGSTSSDPTIPMRVCLELTKDLFILQNHITWVKSITVNNPNPVSYGHFKPVNSKRFLNNIHESVFHLTKTGDVCIDRLAIGVPFEDKNSIKRFKKNTEDKRCRGNVWHIPYKTTNPSVRTNHPAGYPVDLVLNCLKLHGYDESTVCLDPFMGCGTTLEACSILGIKGIGIEIDATYCEQARTRLNPPKTNVLVVE